MKQVSFLVFRTIKIILADKEEDENRQIVFRLRDQLAAELSTHLMQFYDNSEIFVRLSRLFSFIQDVKVSV
jgi:hypothetical protein